MNKRYTLSAFLLFMLFFAVCFFSCANDIAGAGSETTNSEGITGMVCNSDGLSAAPLVHRFPLILSRPEEKR